LRDDLFWHLEALQWIPEPERDVFLLEAGKIALAAMPGTPVVNVLLFLDVPR
jgi:hypothetical protein